MNDRQNKSELIKKSRAVLEKHARSFSFAAPFLDDEARDNAAVVYAFCRSVDDTVDEAKSEQAARAGAARLRKELRDACEQRDDFVAGYRVIEEELKIPQMAADALIDGVESDLGQVRLQTMGELLLYCYRVAGVVGLMMCGILRVRDKNAWAFALDLGIAMQLTNISRDVLEDLSRDRVYLPADALGALDFSALSKDVTQSYSLVKTLLARAEKHYRSAFLGLRYVPARVRLAMFIAGYIYRAIGVKLLKGGAQAMNARVSTTTFEKCMWAARATWAWAFSLVGKKPTHDRTLHDELPEELKALFR